MLLLCFSCPDAVLVLFHVYLLLNPHPVLASRLPASVVTKPIHTVSSEQLMLSIGISSAYAVPWSDYLNNGRDRISHHYRNKQRAQEVKESWTWEELLLKKLHMLHGFTLCLS